MYRHNIKAVLFLILMLPFIMGCSDDLYLTETPVNEELPVEFDFLLPVISNTRGFDEGTDIKKSFKEGDMIHVLGTFQTESLQEGSDDKIKGVLKRYGALRYNGKNWEKVAGNNLTWPTIATSGQFEAYYVSGSNGVLTGTNSSETYLLSALTPTSDPLKATSEDNIGYGRAVRLEFSHICAQLMLVDLEPMVATDYWFYTDNRQDATSREKLVFNNAFKISLGESDEPETEGQPTLNFEFCQVEEDAAYPFIYISADAVETTIVENEKETVITKASYFLEPGFYESFSLCYPAIAPKTYDYLKYDYNNIPENVGGVGVKNTPPNLKAGATYTLTITKSPGVTIVNPPSAGGWDETDVYYEVDVEEFLKAVNNKKGYKKGDVQILEETATGTKLLHNVDFKYFDYSEFEDKSFVPNVMENAAFDGDYHYIRNLGSPLFRYNYGIIQNVGIKDIKFDATSYEDSETNKDMSRYGALCMWNRPNATINNVRVTNVEMNIFVKSDVILGGDGSETHNIGCVIGSNTGKVNEVALAGQFSLHVTGLNEEKYKDHVNASVLIGGFVGQNAAEGEISNVSPLDGTLSIAIHNSCVGEIGSYYVGGIVGSSSGKITDVNLSKVIVDGTQSKGVASYMGGIAGDLSVTESVASTAALNSCIVNGSVRAGTVGQYNALTAASYIGGIAGAVQSVPVADCRTSVTVYGSETASEGVIYATAGAFGRIRDASTYNYDDLIVYGTELKKPSGETATNYAGNFAGIVPKEQTWEKDYAGKNIIIRTFTGFQNIGAALDSQNQQ